MPHLLETRTQGYQYSSRSCASESRTEVVEESIVKAEKRSQQEAVMTTSRSARDLALKRLEESLLDQIMPMEELEGLQLSPSEPAVVAKEQNVQTETTYMSTLEKVIPEKGQKQKKTEKSTLYHYIGPDHPGKGCQHAVTSTCVPQVTHELSNEVLNKNQSSMRSVGMTSQTQSSMTSTMRDMLNRSQEQAQLEQGLSLDVVYITERIISMTFPSEGHDTTYSFNLKEVVRMLKTKHADHILILNLSEKRQDLTKATSQVKDYGWPDHLAPPLERLCSLCKAIDSWLNADVRNVVVLHCKGGRSRIASVIAAYMHYSNICASADQALDRFAMKRFYDDKLGGLPLPSQRRYVRYFSGLLSGAIKINSSPLYLHHILIHGVPNFDTKGGCRPFIKVYQGMQPIFTSGVYNVTDNMQKVCISISPGIPLRGDILIKCYHKKNRSGQREVMWQCQFHTCAISDNSLIFSKQELDDAVTDPRFPDNGKVEFVFGPSSDVLVSVSGFKSDVTVPVDDNEESLARSDSYENFHKTLQALDGYSGHHTAINNHYTSSTINSTNSNLIHTPPPYSQQQQHQVHHQQHQQQQQQQQHIQQQNTLNRRVQTLEERTQLDELLSDLLSEQAYVSPTQRSPGSFQTQEVPVSSPPPTSHHNMNGAKTVTTTTRTYTTYSSTDAHRNPDKVLIQRAEVAYKLPGQGEKEDHYIIAADPSQTLDTGRPSHTPYSNKYSSNAFSYTTLVDGISDHQTSQRSEVVEQDAMRSEQDVMRSGRTSEVQSPPPSSRLPYRPDYDSSRMDTTGSSSFSYSSLDGETNSWLQQQQQKLKNFKEGRDSTGRTEQEKRLVNELKFAQNKYYTRRTQNEEDERQEIMNSYNHQNLLQNGPSTSERVTPSYAPPPPQRTPSTSTVDGPWGPQEQHYSYNSSSYVESRNYGDKRSNKPPPSPTQQRAMPPVAAAPPAPVPARSSSKEYMRNRTNSSSTWQSQQQQQHSMVQRQQSDTLYDRGLESQLLPHRGLEEQILPHRGRPVEEQVVPHRGRPVEHPIQPRPYGSTHSTPPLSPRAISPAGPTSTTTYTTYRTLDRPDKPRPLPQEQMQRAQKAPSQQYAPPPQPTPPPPPQPTPPPTQINHHYITEVFVHRTDLNKDKPDSSVRLDSTSHVDSSTTRVDSTRVESSRVESSKLDTTTERLAELEKNLEAVSQSIKAAQQPPPQQTPPPQIVPRQHQPQQEMPPPPPPPQQVVEETVQSHSESQSFQTFTETKPPEPRVKEIEEDRIMLRPIGPGMQTLEPESAHTGTLGRPTTPGFPTAPVVATQMINPGVPLHQMPQQQQQQQTIQYQQYSQQSHQSHQTHQHQYNTQLSQHDNVPHGTLHIDTSPKMLVAPRSPSSPSSPSNLNTLRQQLNSAHSMSGSVVSPGPHSMTGQSSPSVYFGLSRRGSLSSLADSDMVHTTPKFVKDTSKYWYKAKITRDEAIQMLKDKAPGTFVIRDSNSFPGAFGLALKVAQIPANVQAKPSGDPQADLVRHFLIEPTPKGVRLRGCSNEPVFGSLAAMVYQHSMTPLALPCKLMLPEGDVVDGMMTPESPIGATELNSANTLLTQGAACNVIYINSVDMESLTGPQAVARAVKMTFDNLAQGRTTVVHFKVSNQGITLTDNNRKLFFRRHYPVSTVTYCGIDPQERRWKREIDAPGVQGDAKIFGFVARKQGSNNENSCHIFAELDPEQPANAIVNFVMKVMIGQGKVKS